MEGKEISFNNILDGDAAFELIKDFKEPTVAVIKHCNPCGVASRNTIEEAFKDAYDVDPMSAFGCVIAMNGKCSLEIAKMTKGKYIELLIATKFDSEAVEFIKANKKNMETAISMYLVKEEKGILTLWFKDYEDGNRDGDLGYFEKNYLMNNVPSLPGTEDNRVYKLKDYYEDPHLSNESIIAVRQDGYGWAIDELGIVYPLVPEDEYGIKYDKF